MQLIELYRQGGHVELQRIESRSAPFGFTFRLRLEIMAENKEELRPLLGSFGGVIKNWENNTYKWIVEGKEALPFLRRIEPHVADERIPAAISYLERIDNPTPITAGDFAYHQRAFGQLRPPEHAPEVKEELGVVERALQAAQRATQAEGRI